MYVYIKQISRTSCAFTRCKLRNRVPIVSLSLAFAACVHMRLEGKQVSLFYIVLIDVSHFAVAAGSLDPGGSMIRKSLTFSRACRILGHAAKILRAAV